MEGFFRLLSGLSFGRRHWERIVVWGCGVLVSLGVYEVRTSA
jgi:hypothetical protein